MSLPNLAGLSLEAHVVHDTAVKLKNPCKAPKTPYTKPCEKETQEFVTIELIAFPSDTMGPPVTVETEAGTFPLVSPSPDASLGCNAQQKMTKSSESERGWLRTHYGNNWSKAFPETRILMTEQARRELALKFKPIVDASLRILEMALFKKEYYNEKGLPKLSWHVDVVPALRAAYPNGWEKDSDNKWLSKDAKDARSNQVKADLRVSKEKQLQALFGHPIGYSDWMPGSKEKQLQTQLLGILVPKQKALVEQLVNELGYPKTKYKRRATALCRHWFNRKGTDGKMRSWHSHAGSDDGVTKDIHDKRYKWAEKIVMQPNYNPSNPPQPPDDLYVLLLDIKPTNESYLPDGIDNISEEGGQWLWRYMRRLENAKFDPSTTVYQALELWTASIDNAAQYWKPEFRQAQQIRLQCSYKEFIASVDEMSDIPQAKNVAISYTVGSGKFNKYLLWPSDKIGGDPSKIPNSGSGAGGVANDMGSGQIGPPDDLHRLYKLINRCPRLQEPAVFIRGVNRTEDLPHNLGRAQVIDPKIGHAYLNVTFMSTSSAAPDAYMQSPLDNFFDASGSCCMFAITMPKGSAVLPLVVGGNDLSEYSSEQEVLLPPGLLLIYQGKRQMSVGSATTTVHFYEAVSPPKVDL